MAGETERDATRPWDGQYRAYPSARKPEGWAAPTGEWGPDVLGEGFEARTLRLAARVVPTTNSASGKRATGAPTRTLLPQEATLVRYRPTVGEEGDAPTPGVPAPRFVVLYIHGWNDYFFQWEVARLVDHLGGALYALDLRGNGRSIRDGLLHSYIDDLGIYTEDIDAAWRVIDAEVPGVPRILGAHSTGGLVAVLWTADHPGMLSGLVLNSPWLESIPVRGLAKATASALHALTGGESARLVPVRGSSRYMETLSGILGIAGTADATQEIPEPKKRSDAVSKSLSNTLEQVRTASRSKTKGHNPGAGGEHVDPFVRGWDLEPTWRLPSAPVYVGWVAAVLRSQARVAEGLSIDCPILVLTSARSGLGLGASLRGAMDTLGRDRPADDTSDIVLDVPAMRRAALNLGARVAFAAIDGAIHDVFSSARPARQSAHRELTRWLRGIVDL